MIENAVLAANAAIEAARAIMDIYETDFGFEKKSDQSPVTIADLRANGIINESLSVSEFPVLSEENEEIPYEIRQNWTRFWMVDPLDGTKEFINKNGDFTVNIALIEKKSPVLGVIVIPLTKEVYIGMPETLEAYKLNLQDWREINKEDILRANKLSPKAQNKDRIRVLISRSHLDNKTKAFIDELQLKYNEVKTIQRGSSLKFCLLAEDKADFYPRFSPTMEWDTAAGQAICEAVGISLISLQTGEQMVYNRKSLLNMAFLVG